MSQATQIDGSFITVNLDSTAVLAFSRIKIGTNGLWTVAGLTDYGSAVLQQDGAAGQTALTAKLTQGGNGTQTGISTDNSTTIGQPLYSAADGNVSEVKGTGAVQIGVAKTGAAAPGAIIEYFTF